MKNVLGTLISLCLVVWIGAELFFPVVAAISFLTLSPDTHTAGRIVGACLRVVHYEGLVSGALLAVLVVFARSVGLFSPRTTRISLGLLVLMISLTATSQFGIIPRLETYRVAAGGIVDAAPVNAPARVAFNRLHKTSEHVEELILLFGLVLIGVVSTSQGAGIRTTRE